MGFNIMCQSVFVAALFVVAAAQNMLGNETDRLALLAIKAGIRNDPFQITSSWNDSVHFCQWNGVTCGRRHQRVTQLHLKSLNLKGQISPWISNLSFIRIINLSNNNLDGEIPGEIAQLFRLRELVLGNNSLVGEIPRNLSSCSELRLIYLRSNNLRGKIPVELGSLPRLDYISVAENNLSGNIPPELGNLTFLTVLDLATNNLEGILPGSLGRLKALFALQTSSNFLSGIIPRSIYNLTKLTHFFIGSNMHEGRIPDDIGVSALPNIEWFNVFENQFTGPIPVSFANASNLFSFQISYNGFSGGVPNIFGNLAKLGTVLMQSTNLGSGKEKDLDFFTSLANCSNLRNLILIHSNFGGKFPTSIANFSKNFETLDMSGNLISGEIPSSIGNLINLQTLFVKNNLLSGNIPTTFGKLKKLEALSLSFNRLSGEIPSALGNSTSLLVIVLRGNNLRGILPSSLRNCNNLQSLSLSSNILDGAIPQFVTEFPYLSIMLDLSRNKFSGSLPTEIGNLRALDLLDVSHNRLSGVIPQRLGDAMMLRELYMDHNMLEGKIPESLSSLRGIEEIDFSQNNLSGEIPKDISKLVFLVKLNLSFNDLEGEVPTGGVLSNASAVSVTGNLRLCGGIAQLQLQACVEKKSAKHSLFLKHKGKFIISIIFGILAVPLMFFLAFSWWFKKRIKKDVKTSSINALTSVSYGDLLKATDGFAPENLLGEGSIGLVYKGALEADQMAVAVKVFNLNKRGASKSFASECETLKGIRHRNLVKIITACSSIDYQGNEFKALVYELMPNGNLDNLLHHGRHNDELNPYLDLSKRIDIVIDVASAVDYLHNNVGTPIVHCDIKPSNILLDQENRARVGDFGLSRVILDENLEISNNNHSSSSGLKGTIGYAAPEYGMGSKVSKEGDVYSFGILLLEIFTGKRPTSGDFGNGLNLNQFVNTALPGRVTHIVDQGIIPMEENGETRKVKICECCVSVLKIGVMCSDEFPRARLNINEALKLLLAAKKMLQTQ